MSRETGLVRRVDSRRERRRDKVQIAVALVLGILGGLGIQGVRFARSEQERWAEIEEEAILVSNHDLLVSRLTGDFRAKYPGAGAVVLSEEGAWEAVRETWPERTSISIGRGEEGLLWVWIDDVQDIQGDYDRATGRFLPLVEGAHFVGVDGGKMMQVVGDFIDPLPEVSVMVPISGLSHDEQGLVVTVAETSEFVFYSGLSLDPNYPAKEHAVVFLDRRTKPWLVRAMEEPDHAWEYFWFPWTSGTESMDDAMYDVRRWTLDSLPVKITVPWEFVQ